MIFATLELCLSWIYNYVVIASCVIIATYSLHCSCWMDSDDGVIFAFIGPIAAIILVGLNITVHTYLHNAMYLPQITVVFLVIALKVLCLNKRKVMRVNDEYETNKRTAKYVAVTTRVYVTGFKITCLPRTYTQQQVKLFTITQ